MTIKFLNVHNQRELQNKIKNDIKYMSSLLNMASHFQLIQYLHLHPCSIS
jgi:hypothetical protein